MLERRPEFPGTDPWLEHPELWPDVHNRLITSIADTLAAELSPRYFVGVESRTTIVHADPGERRAIPDVAIRALESSMAARTDDPVPGAADDPQGVTVLELELPFVAMEVDEWFLEIRALPSRKVVTAIAVLSPTNKRPGPGRRRYLRKRDRVLDSRTSLVEIDLIRDGRPMPMFREMPPGDDYRILVCRGRARPRATYYGFGCRVAIPDVPIPLLPGEPEAVLPLNRVLHDLITRAQYFAVVEYDSPPVPPLRPADAEWAAAIVNAARTPQENS